MKAPLAALLSGSLFGIGLCVSGMSDPANIIAFLDVSGEWSPNLAGVMLGAIAVHATWLRWGARVRPPAGNGSRGTGPRIDGALVGGAALFGVGWGISGYCPGPAIVALGSGARGAMVFVAAMAMGMVLNEVAQWKTRRSGKRSAIHIG